MIERIDIIVEWRVFHRDGIIERKSRFRYLREDKRGKLCKYLNWNVMG